MIVASLPTASRARTTWRGSTGGRLPGFFEPVTHNVTVRRDPTRYDGTIGPRAGFEILVGSSLLKSPSMPESQSVSSTVDTGRPRTKSDSNLKERVRSLRLPKEATPGAAGLSKLAWLAAIGAIACGAYAGYRQFLQPDDDPNRNTVSAAAPANPRSAPPGDAASAPAANSPSPRGPDTVPAVNRTEDRGLALEAKGYLIPAKQVLVSPKVSGMIEKLNVVEGKRFEKGAVLAELEKTEYQADLKRAEAALEVSRQRYEELRRGFRKEEVEQAQAELGEAQEQLDKATKDLQRNTTLWKSRAISQEEFESAQSQMRALERRVERLRFALKLLQIGAREERIQAAAADVQQSEADVTKARWKLDNTVIRAPISGTILKKNSEEGNIVNSIAFNGSYSICDMADLSDMEVELTIQERDISRIFTGQECRVRADAYPERVYSGRVSRVMPIADRAKGAVPIRVKVDIPAAEEGVYLKPEMGAVVSFLRKADSVGAKSPEGRQPEASPAPAKPPSRNP